MPRYRRHFFPGQTVFLTLATSQRLPLLRDGARCEHVLAALRSTKERHPFRHHAHAILHDHLHLLLSPQGVTPVPILVGSFKRALLAKLGAEGQRNMRFWQRRYYDHVIRNEDDFSRHLDYVHFNPVKHGLASKPAEWKWSSFHAWLARGAYPPDWGCQEPDHIRHLSE